MNQEESKSRKVYDIFSTTSHNETIILYPYTYLSKYIGFLPEFLALGTGCDKGGDVSENASPVLHHRGGLAPQQLDQEHQALLLTAHVALVLLAVGGQVPEGREDHLEAGLVLPVGLHGKAHGRVHQALGAHGHGGSEEHLHHFGLGQDGLGALICLPGEIPEQVGRGLAKILPVAFQLVDHDLHEAGEGGEVGLDAGVAKGQVCESHHRVPPDFATLDRACVWKMSLILHLAKNI